MSQTTEFWLHLPMKGRVAQARMGRKEDFMLISEARCLRFAQSGAEGREEQQNSVAKWNNLLEFTVSDSTISWQCSYNMEISNLKLSDIFIVNW